MIGSNLDKAVQDMQLIKQDIETKMKDQESTIIRKIKGVGQELSSEQVAALDENQRATMEEKLKKTTISSGLLKASNLLSRTANFYTNLNVLRESLGYGDKFEIYDFDNE